MNSKLFALAVVLGALPQTSAAVIHSETHNITGSSPTTSWNVVNNTSLGGETRRFAFTTFTVSTTGSYAFLEAGGGTISDSVVGIYGSTFTSADLSTGWLAGDDDFDWEFGSGVGVNLTAGQSYTIVTSSYRRVEEFDELGSIDWQVSGPDGATLTPVPEPEMVGMVAATGLLGLSVWRRARRNSASAHA